MCASDSLVLGKDGKALVAYAAFNCLSKSTRTQTQAWLKNDTYSDKYTRSVLSALQRTYGRLMIGQRFTDFQNSSDNKADIVLFINTVAFEWSACESNSEEGTLYGLAVGHSIKNKK